MGEVVVDNEGRALSLRVETLDEPRAVFEVDRCGVVELRRSFDWRPWSDVVGGMWYRDDWSVEAEVLGGWEATGGGERRVTHLYLVRFPELRRTASNAYPAELGRWALRCTSTRAPVGYGDTRFYRSERAALEGMEETARSHQAIGHCYLGSGSGAATRQAAETLSELRSQAWHAAHVWTPAGYRLRPGHTDPSERWAETAEQVAARVWDRPRENP